ncbi:RidA family protein [Shimia ponticola]|uniref:RidA family protein n=1 Tax=Shimia ponticola TaxID=2582893 RepID=UPI0011BD6400|nr:RidA family protein [Shimia ponticola]
MIKRIKSGGVYEEKIGYCRAVVAGDWIHVAGTVAAGPDVPEAVQDQCASALSIIEDALEKAGASMAEVVRVTYYLPRAADFEACWPLLSSTFGANPPAATMIECNLIDPKYKIEIEVTAYTGS